MKLLRSLSATLLLATYLAAAATDSASADTAATLQDVPILIVIGQSNADGSAFFDPAIDADMRRWYTSEANTRRMKIWYRSTRVEECPANALGEGARWVVDGDVEDAPAGWMDLWYRNENDSARTAMNMIHNVGTYSTGEGTGCAQGRRGMEGAFGRVFATELPDSELYILKLGVSGSFISSWANEADDTNWNYFYNNIFTPAIADLLARGKRPCLTGVWWMQGCADAACTREYYQSSLIRLVNRVNNELGFPGARFYVGHVVKPGESDLTPSGSTAYSSTVRDAQEAVAGIMAQVEIVPTAQFAMQYEPNFHGYIHFSHAGVNAIGTYLAHRILSTGPAAWIPYRPTNR